MERRLSGRSKKPVDYKAFAGADSDEEDFQPEPKRARGDTDSADQVRTTKPAISKPSVQKKPAPVQRPAKDSDDDGRFRPEDEGLSDSEPATPEESDDEEFHLDESPPSDDDSGSDFEPEAGARKKRATPVKKPVKGGARKPTKASGRGRGSGRAAGKAPGRGRKDPSLSPESPPDSSSPDYSD